MRKKRCDLCKFPVFESTLHTWGGKRVCTECAVSCKTGRKIVIKYGTAEHVTKKDGRAFISDRKLKPEELEKVATGKKQRKKITVADENFRTEDEADVSGS